MAIETKNPRGIMEDEEVQREKTIQAAAMEQAGFAMGRVLIWILSAGALESVGLRAYVVVYKLRPDLINGMTLDEIAGLRGVGRSFTHKLAKDFTDTFAINGINSRSVQTRRTLSESWARVNPTSPIGVDKLNHLSLINWFTKWLNSGKHRRMTQEELSRDFQPVIQFVRTIHKF